jgi:hypothetical protein
VTRISLFAAAFAVAALAGQALAEPPPGPPTVKPQAPDTNPPQAAPGQPPSQPTDLHPNGSITPGLKEGMAVKDNTGAAIGSITTIKPDGTGRQFATIKMGEQAFQVDASSLAVANGEATINLTAAQIQSMLKQPS